MAGPGARLLLAVARLGTRLLSEHRPWGQAPGLCWHCVVKAKNQPLQSAAAAANPEAIAGEPGL